MVNKRKSAAARKFPNIFYIHRKPGKSSPKSLMFFAKKGPKFSTLTPQQKKIKEAGQYCGSIIAAHPELYAGSGKVKDRRMAMKACILKQFGKEVPKELEKYLPK